MGCGFLRRIGSSRVGKGFSRFHGLSNSKNLSKNQNFSTAAGSPDNNFFNAVFGKFYSLSFQGFLGVKNASEWWVGLSVRSAFSSSKNQVLSAADKLSHGAVRVGKRLSMGLERLGKKIFQGHRLPAGRQESPSAH